MESSDPTEKIIYIPAYPDQAGKLLHEFQDSVGRILTVGMATEFMMQYQDFVVTNNNGLGESDQIIEVRPENNNLLTVTDSFHTDSDHSGLSHAHTLTSVLRKTDLASYTHLSRIILDSN